MPLLEILMPEIAMTKTPVATAKYTPQPAKPAATKQAPARKKRKVSSDETENTTAEPIQNTLTESTPADRRKRKKRRSEQDATDQLRNSI